MTETPVQEWAFNPAEILASTRKVQGIFHQPVVDKDGELITPKGMREAVPDFMHLPALHDFHKERPVGLATKVKELSGGRFWFEGVIKSTPDCDDIWEKVKTGNYDQVSIFGKRTKYNNQCSLPQNMRSGACITDGVRLDSISVCDDNARNPQTSLEVKKAKVIFDAEIMKAETTSSNLQHASTDYADEKDMGKSKARPRKVRVSVEGTKRGDNPSSNLGLVNSRGKSAFKKCPKCREDPNTISKDVEKGKQKEQIQESVRQQLHTRTEKVTPVNKEKKIEEESTPNSRPSSGTARRTLPLAIRSRKEPMDTISTHFEAKKQKRSPYKSESPPEHKKGIVRVGVAPENNPPRGHSHTGEEEDLPYKTVDGKRQSTTVQGHRGRYDQGSERSATTHKVYSHPGAHLGGNQVTPPNEETRTKVQQTHGKKLETRSAKMARMYPDAAPQNSPQETKQMKQEKTKEEQLHENRNRQKRDNRALAKETKKAGEGEDMEKGVRPKITEEPIEGKGSTTQKVRRNVRERGEIRAPDMKKGIRVVDADEDDEKTYADHRKEEKPGHKKKKDDVEKSAAEDLEDESYDEEEDKDFDHVKHTDKDGEWSKDKDPNGTVKMSKAQDKGKPESEEEEDEPEEAEEEEEEEVDKAYSRPGRSAVEGREQRKPGLHTNKSEAASDYGARQTKKISSRIKKGDEDAASESFNPSTVTKGEHMDEYEEDVEYVTKALVPIEEIDTIVKARTEEISKAYVAQLDEIKKAYDTKFVELSSKIEKMENETIRKGGSVVVIPELLSGTDGSSSNADALARMQAGR